jgi:hypothetical protein|tara:strand:- start:565 stop:816 length:252 start_codon:yes stop_codon:yes gene_type:complete
LPGEVLEEGPGAAGGIGECGLADDRQRHVFVSVEPDLVSLGGGATDDLRVAFGQVGDDVDGRPDTGIGEQVQDTVRHQRRTLR